MSTKWRAGKHGLDMLIYEGDDLVADLSPRKDDPNFIVNATKARDRVRRIVDTMNTAATLATEE